MDPSTAADEIQLRTSGLVKTFGQFTAVDEVSLAVRPGEFRSIIGPNGAGKTTLFHLISGGLPVTAGSVHFEGADITDLPARERVRRGIGRSFQISNIFGGLTVRENVRLAAQAAERDGFSILAEFLRPTQRFEAINDRTQSVLERVDLAGMADTEAASLAHGDKRRLEIGVVLAADPSLVMLDEPTAGMSLEETQRTIELLEDVLADRTLLLIEHDMELVMGLSDRITVLHRGQVIADGTPEEVADDPVVQEAYLGGVIE
ncbi:MAG: ABC transporter ATP-binding protein [Halobacteriota archaeon]